MDALWHAYPHTLIEASGSHVGLPDQQMGNSEVGHLTIGAGRIIRQELVRISDTVRKGQLGQNPVLNKLVERIKQRGGTLHLLGLCSDGGVHSHVDHLCGLIQAADSGLSNLAVQPSPMVATPTQSAPSYISQLETALSRSGVGQLASLCGRYWAMDRDQRWNRTEKAYNLYTDPEIAVDTRTPDQVLTASYSEGITDEFLEPVRLQNSVMKDGDSVLVFNFRPDRARQIVQALCLSDFDAFERSQVPQLDLVTFTQVEQDLPVHVAFPPEPLDQLLGQVVADHDSSSTGLLKQRNIPTSPTS